MRTNLACRLGLINNGQHKSTNRLLFLVPHDTVTDFMAPEKWKSWHAADEGPENKDNQRENGARSR